MSASKKALMFAAGLFLTMALIGIFVNVFSPSMDAAKTAQTDFSSTTTDLKDQKYLIYDNTVVSGSQVLNALRKFEKEGETQSLALYVETGRNADESGVWYYSTFTSDAVTDSGVDNLGPANDTTSQNYINPSGMFEAKVVRDTNGVIRAIKFIQQ